MSPATAETLDAIRQKYEPVIGLEVHCQLLTRTKIFCGCSTKFGAPPNANTCPVCLGMPGALPVLNREAVAMAVKASMAINCTINRKSVFARKNYFYPDLPKGYQISQFDQPIAEHGWITLHGSGEEKRIGITRLHMEEDAGKSIHDGFADSYSRTYVDLNRSGTPLVEIVSEPDIRTPEEAYEYLTRLKQILLYIGVSDCNMEEGSLRCDANVSIRPRGQKEFGTKVEIKNLNSFRFLQKSLEYEIERQAQVLDEGGKIAQETRLWNTSQNRTESMRSKEQAHDYRYFPEPDLLPLIVNEKWQAEIRSAIPELPDAKRSRFMKDYGLSGYDADVLTDSQELADYYEAVAKSSPAGSENAKLAANWVMVELMGALNGAGLELSASPVSAEHLGGLMKLIADGTISGKMAKEVFARMFSTGKTAPAVVDELGLKQITDDGPILDVIRKVIAANPKQLEQFKSGKAALFGYFVGQVMRETKGQANPAKVNDLLKAELEKA
jgi:aspartyl-tRNA(Asn)/glutamyl-tRNA(Gln) amidotransferase subunit B